MPARALGGALVLCASLPGVWAAASYAPPSPPPAPIPAVGFAVFFGGDLRPDSNLTADVLSTLEQVTAREIGVFQQFVSAQLHAESPAIVNVRAVVGRDIWPVAAGIIDSPAFLEALREALEVEVLRVELFAAPSPPPSAPSPPPSRPSADGPERCPQGCVRTSGQAQSVGTAARALRALSSGSFAHLRARGPHAHALLFGTFGGLRRGSGDGLAPTCPSGCEPA